MAWSPSTTCASPRYSESVPMVTTMEGSFQRVTSQPLSAPQAAPVTKAASTMVPTPAPACMAKPMAIEASAMMAAMDRSISPPITSSAMASAISAFSEKL
ncbi:hypothetical protein FQZ97_962870 [compost metagenome]